jgi:Tol biopolymer transport system component
MKTRFRLVRGTSVVLLLLIFAHAALSASLELVTSRLPSVNAVAGANSDSSLAAMSPDGRFILFASAATDLVSHGTIDAPPVLPAPLNAYLRDGVAATTRLLSVNAAGTGGGNGDSFPMGVSTNGRYALFESSATDLVANDTNKAADVFLRDLETGATLLVSAATNGAVGNAGSRSAVMTPDGRYVAFVSEAVDLVAGDTNGMADVFVRDMREGTTRLVSVGARSRAELYANASESPLITPDGRRVVFFSSATNLVATVPPGARGSVYGEIYLRDLVEDTTTWVSAGALPALRSVTGAADAISFNHTASEDGRYVAYQATTSQQKGPAIILRYDLMTGATDLVHTNAAALVGRPEDFHNLDISADGRWVAFVASVSQTVGVTTSVRVWDAATGKSVLASGDRDGRIPDGSTADLPAIDPTGRYVAFWSDAEGLVTNRLAGPGHVYVRDLTAGLTLLVDADPEGAGAGVSPISAPQISGDAKIVAFDAPDGTLVSNDHNQSYDVFARNLGDARVELVSARDPAAVGITPNGASALSQLSVTADGRYLAFTSVADDLIAGDENGYADIFLHDLAGGTNQLVSAGPGGLPGNGVASEPSVSADGRYVAFTSLADNLAAGDTNNLADVFVREVTTGVITLVSVTPDGLRSGDGESFSPILSSDGKFVLFRSKALDLVPGRVTRAERVFLRNLKSGVTYLLAAEGARLASMTPDGRFVAFTETSLYLWDSERAARVYTNNIPGIDQFFLSPDGTRLLLQAGSGTASLMAADLAANTNWTVSFGVVPRALTEARFSRGGGLAAYTWRLNSTRQVYLYDFQARTNWLVSRASGSGEPGNADSDSVDISPDGRFVTFRSAAANLVSGDNNGVPDVFLHDALTGTTTLLSASRFGPGSANNRSLRPVFTGDGGRVLFLSWASDLVGGDFNQEPDIFGYRIFAGSAVPVFVAAFVPDGDPARPPWITWPVVPGKGYRVQYKNSLDDPRWLDLEGAVSIQGGQARLQDAASDREQKFYRILAF